MQNKRINCTVGSLELAVAWVVLAVYVLHVWLSGRQFPPTPVMLFLIVGLATATVVYTIARTSTSAKASFELGREVERVIPTSRNGSPTLRAVDDEVGAR